MGKNDSLYLSRGTGRVEKIMNIERDFCGSERIRITNQKYKRLFLTNKNMKGCFTYSFCKAAHESDIRNVLSWLVFIIKTNITLTLANTMTI